MTDMFVFSFHYNNSTYKAIANKWKESNGYYRITVMNGDLERLLFGNNIVSPEEGWIDAADNSGNTALKELQEALLAALHAELHDVEKLAS